MTRIGYNLWYFDQSYWWIGQTTTSGGLGATFYPSDNTIKDLAWDGTNIWAINPSGILTGYNPSGSLTKAIPGLITGGWGLTCDGTFLWAADPKSDKIYQISLQGEIPKGDVNRDGNVDLLDLVDIVNHILGLHTLEGISFSRADCNEDGLIDVIDALGLVRVILEVGDCESFALKVHLTDQEIDVLRSLKSHISPQEYSRFMTLVKNEIEIPNEYTLFQNYPNPFNPETEIAFRLPEAAQVTVTVNNVLGEVIDVLVDSQCDAGTHSIRWSGESFASGVYFYRLITEKFTSTKSMVLLK